MVLWCSATSIATPSDAAGTCRYDLDAWFHVGDWLYEYSVATDSVRFDTPPQGKSGSRQPVQ